MIEKTLKFPDKQEWERSVKSRIEAELR